jgi:GNAT superfamily N-acetyltransferase
VRISALDPATASDADIVAVQQVKAAALAVDRPGHPAEAVEDVAAELRTPLRGRRRLRYVAEMDGRIVGSMVVRLPDTDNLHVGLLDLVVHPDVRRRGVGTGLLDRALVVLTREDRRVLIGDTEEGSAGAAFCAALGLREVRTDQLSLLRMADIDWADVEALAAAEHPGYRLVGWRDTCPEELLGPFARAKHAMNDAPTGAMDVTARDWSTEFIRDRERECRFRGWDQWVLAAVHAASGEIAGFTEVELWRWTPARSEQADTAVVAAHRGHGLGLWLKAAMLRRLRRERPDVTGLLTGNAASNTAMLGINVRLGYRPYVRLIEWQGAVPDLARRSGPGS